jgi:hypothetical protein
MPPKKGQDLVAIVVTNCGSAVSLTRTLPVGNLWPIVCELLHDRALNVLRLIYNCLGVGRSCGRVSTHAELPSLRRGFVVSDRVLHDESLHVLRVKN